MYGLTFTWVCKFKAFLSNCVPSAFWCISHVDFGATVMYLQQSKANYDLYKCICLFIGTFIDL